MSEPKAPRFSDAAVEVLVEQVRSRKEVFFPSDGRKMPRQTLRQAWKEVALNVNAGSEVLRTGVQCRKKFNDLTRTARDKLAHKPRKRTCIQDLTQMEQDALDIIWIAYRRRMENDMARGQVQQGLSHYLGPAMQDLEGGHPTDDAPSPGPSFQYTSAGISKSGGKDGQLEGSTQGESFTNSEQELTIVERSVRETDDQRASSDSSCAEEDKGGDFSGPAFKRKISHVHHQLLEALDSLSRSCLTLSGRVEESASILWGVLPQGLTTLQSTMERVGSTMEAAIRPSVQEPVAPALASLIDAQTGAIQALACTISSGLERLGECIDRGFSRVSDLLQSALPQLSNSGESHTRGSGTAGVAHAAFSQDGNTSDPSSPPQTPTALRPGSLQDLTARGSGMRLGQWALGPRGQLDPTAPGPGNDSTPQKLRRQLDQTGPGASKPTRLASGPGSLLDQTAPGPESRLDQTAPAAAEMLQPEARSLRSQVLRDCHKGLLHLLAEATVGLRQGTPCRSPRVANRSPNKDE
ncbi:myb-related transcription factor, partner of profilin-like [Heptranchias perlo]|uniref:myb-related transcription factor, partner of profilin-like n=1 Tax=Heptranchias perlo TaxID=212740 RepID=UPI003559A4ED